MINSLNTTKEFLNLINEIPQIGFKRHAANLIQSARNNLSKVKKSIRDVHPPERKKLHSAVIVSAGPSVHKRQSIKRILDAKYKGTIIAIDGSYVACLKAGLIPDYVITLDPHPTRVVRWFGDHHFEQNTFNDDYFSRQDLDADFRKNSIEHNQENIELVNKFGRQTKAIVATSAAENVVNRLMEAKFDIYWWNPLVDNPRDKESVTGKIYEINKLPCMNTGGTVGTAAWVFAATRLKIKNIALIGMDYGYYSDTPIEQTQTYYELLDRVGSVEELKKYFVRFTFLLTGEQFYTDPTYFWYRNNFLELLKHPTEAKTFNCTEAGTLTGEHIPCIFLDEFLRKNR